MRVLLAAMGMLLLCGCRPIAESDVSARVAVLEGRAKDTLTISEIARSSEQSLTITQTTNGSRRAFNCPKGSYVAAIVTNQAGGIVDVICRPILEID